MGRRTLFCVLGTCSYPSPSIRLLIKYKKSHTQNLCKRTLRRTGMESCVYLHLQLQRRENNSRNPIPSWTWYTTTEYAWLVNDERWFWKHLAWRDQTKDPSRLSRSLPLDPIFGSDWHRRICVLFIHLRRTQAIVTTTCTWKMVPWRVADLSTDLLLLDMCISKSRGLRGPKGFVVL